MSAPRAYFYWIDRRGRLTHDGTELTDRRFLKFFFERLQSNDTDSHSDYPYVSPCGGEMNYVRCEDSPIVFTDLRKEDTPGEPESAVLVYGPGLQVPFRPRDLRFSEKGLLYHSAPIGEFGRLSSSLTLELGSQLEPWGPYYAFLEGDGRRTIVAPLRSPEGITVLHGRPDNECFGCGGANPVGLGMSFLFDREKRRAQSWLQPDAKLQGGPNRMHGGFIALLLDEVMAKVLTGMDLSGACPTARMEVDFRRPIDIGSHIELRGELEQQEGRKYWLRGQLRAAAAETSESPDGDDLPVLAEARALYVKVLDAGKSPAE